MSLYIADTRKSPTEVWSEARLHKIGVESLLMLIIILAEALNQQQIDGLVVASTYGRSSVAR